MTLPEILKDVDWISNINTSFSNANSLKKLEQALMRIAVWSKQFEILDEDNPALCFTREMQIAAQNAAALLGLCLYKASAASSRTLVETCLYYTYFRTHPEELSTLVRNSKYYISKMEILEYHKMHTRGFVKFQSLFGLVGRLDSWYSNVSAVVHGQIPGAWTAHTSLKEIGHNPETQKLALQTFYVAEEIVHQMFLCTVGNSLWAGISPDAKQFLIKGLAGDKKKILHMDAK